MRISLFFIVMEPTEITRSLGQRIRSLRQARGLSQESLAEQAGSGLHPTYVSEIELGKANVSISTLVSLAAGLKMTLPELVEFQPSDEDAAIVDLVSLVRSLDERQREVFLEAARAMLKGMLG
jgi:transcriptional regulator with XRE-family HTH domain